jgi:NAD(P) transhydrogenase subunit alpha
MRIGIPRELHPREHRAPIIPVHAEKLTKAGVKLIAERGLGDAIGVSDAEYEAAGVEVKAERSAVLSGAEAIVRLRKPPLEEIEQLRTGGVHISLLDPFNDRELVEAFRQKGISAVSLQMIPRSTRAQKMDVLSSQANLAGYEAVIIAAERLRKILPMMMTPAGTIAPSRVFVIGAGVAGLQAIATAKRLGARVEAFDTRPVVEEQVRSLGAKFVKIDLGETGQTDQGYARELSAEQLEKQREAMARVCASSDVVITTALVFGRPAPRIVTRGMIESMQPGAVIVDCAVESGGNVEGSKLDQEVMVDGVRIIGQANLPGRAAVHASQMFSANLFNFIDEFWDAEAGRIVLDGNDEIVESCLITREGEIVNQRVREAYESARA